MPPAVGDRRVLAAYAVTIFLSAFLLFQIQPLVSKSILPWFGGSPAVWTTCLLFFQTLLFVGYAYAFFIDQRLAPRQQAIVHVSLIAASIALVGVLPDERWEPRGESNPLQQILLMLSVSVGLLFLVLSATGPLLQAWFARTFPDRGVYRLYALSNAGSLLALVSYPFFFERRFDIPRQATIWSAGFVLFAMFCGYIAWRQSRSRVSPKRGSEFRRNSATFTPIWTHRLLWLLWPACGSVVLMATTNHVSTDIAATPLLWIVPLALYLVTFIIAFDRPTWYRPTLIAAVTLAAIYAAAFVHRNGVGPIDRAHCGTPGRLYQFNWEGEAPAKPPPRRDVGVPAEPQPPKSKLRISSTQFLAANFAAMFFICLVCHGELVRHRPPARYLTSFYLMIAAGGALGGAFITLLAPRLFATYLEWQLSLVIAAVFAIGRLLRAVVNAAFRDEESTALPWRAFLLAPIVFLPAAVVLLDLAEFLPYSNKGVQLRTRNFFGTLAVRERAPDDPLARNFVLQHGAITHGAQFAHESRHREPITYFSPASGVGRAIEHYRTRAPQPSGGMRLGVVGLGVGTLAAYLEAGDAATFYEINPAVVDISRNNPWFSYLRDASARGAHCDIKLGDGRLTLRHELTSISPPSSGEGSGEGPISDRRSGEGPGEHFDLLVLDAFSGDSVPVHLLTIEAFEIYLAHFADDSATIAVNISNRYIDLEPVVRGIAEHFNLRWLRIHNRRNRANGIYSADWIILTRNDSLIAALTPYARPAQPKPAILWTDSYSSLFDILK